MGRRTGGMSTLRIEFFEGTGQDRNLKRWNNLFATSGMFTMGLLWSMIIYHNTPFLLRQPGKLLLGLPMPSQACQISVALELLPVERKASFVLQVLYHHCPAHI
jgi:hypothetical protein